MCATFALVGEAEVLKLVCSGERRFCFDHEADGAKPSRERSLRGKGVVLLFLEPIWFWSSDLASWRPASIRSAIHSNSGLASAGPTKVVGAGRFELPTPCSRSKCATRLRYAPPDRQPEGTAPEHALQRIVLGEGGFIALEESARKRGPDGAARGLAGD